MSAANDQSRCSVSVHIFLLLQTLAARGVAVLRLRGTARE
jgi:hypothetical protein